jgi:hypothetical protein
MRIIISRGSIKNNKNQEVLLSNTVKENTEWFTCKEYEAAKLAFKMQGILDYPSAGTYKRSIADNYNKNFPTSAKDSQNSEKVF